MTTATTLIEIPVQVSRRKQPSRRHARGFWVVAYIFAVTMASAAAPAPLYGLYARRDGFGPAAITVIFAAYAVGVVLSLFLAGHLSDRFGRRRIVVPGVVLNVLALLIFAVWRDLGALLAARFISGVGVGMLAATATAHIAELHRAARPSASAARAEIVSTAANLGGIGLGPLVGGAIAQYVPNPLFSTYAVFLFLLVGGLLLVVTVPETVHGVDDGPWTYRPQRVAVPSSARRAYLAAGAMAFVSFAMFGFFTSLAPSFLANQLHIGSHLVAGLLSFLVFGSAAVTQVVVGRLPRGAVTPLGFGALTAGLVVLVAAILVTSFPVLIAGGVLTGIGAGAAFKAAVGSVIGIAPPQTRGEALAGLFLMAYLGISVPVIMLGVLVQVLATGTAIVIFGAVMLVVLAGAAAGMLRRRAA